MFLKFTLSPILSYCTCVLLLAIPVSISVAADSQDSRDTDSRERLSFKRLTIDATELYSKLDDVIDSDPRHVYPLLLLLRGNDKAPLAIRDESTYVTMPANLTRVQARQIVDFAFDDAGHYRGFSEFWDRFTRYLEDTRLHEQQARVVDVRVVSREGGSPSVIRITTTDHNRMCGVEPENLIKHSGKHDHVTEVSLESVKLQPFDIEGFIEPGVR